MYEKSSHIHIHSIKQTWDLASVCHFLSWRDICEVGLYEVLIHSQRTTCSITFTQSLRCPTLRAVGRYFKFSCLSPPTGGGMKPRSWLRRNWLWAAGGAFVTIHLATWLMQRAMRSSVRSEAALKHKTTEEKLDWRTQTSLLTEGQKPACVEDSGEQINDPLCPMILT